MIELIPIEFNVAGIYMPPLLIAGVIGLIMAMLTARYMNRTRLSRHFFYPPLVFVALTLIYSFAVETVISAL
jgi:hypothetical protein